MGSKASDVGSASTGGMGLGTSTITQSARGGFGECGLMKGSIEG